MYIGLILVVLATFCQGEVVRECTFKAYLNDYLSDRTYGLLPCRYFEHGVLPKETLVVDISPNDTQGLWDECGKSDEYPCRFRDKLYWKKAYYWRENMADHHMFLIHIATIMKVSNHVIIITN